MGGNINHCSLQLTVCFRSAVLLMIVLSFNPVVWANDLTDMNDNDVHLLKFPYPYKAALTVCSDTHATPVETFEAVHRLINSRERIERGSNVWQRLFSDAEIGTRDTWKDGMQGFGLPIADTMFLYDPHIGVFASFNEKTGEPVTHEYGGRDFRDIIGTWLEHRWIDALHTPGEGYLPREATAAGLKWLKERKEGNLKVWVNHGKSRTPTCVASDARSVSPVAKNTIKYSTAILCWVGMEGLAKRFASQPRPSKYPRHQRVLLRSLEIFLLCSLLWLLLCLLYKRLRKRKYFLIGGGISCAVIVGLFLTPYQPCLGDNPESPLYLTDLLRDFGIRYYWAPPTSNPISTDLLRLSERLLDETYSEKLRRLALPEKSFGRRPSFLSTMVMDDGASYIVFGRAYKGGKGIQSLELLTHQALTELIDQHGTSIIYTHWTEFPKKVFTAKGLDGLQRLKDFYESGHIWVAPTSDILHFSFIRSCLEFGVQYENGRRIIDITRVASPLGEPIIPTLDDLQGITFECSGDRPTELRVAGNPLDLGDVERLVNAERIVLRIPFKQND